MARRTRHPSYYLSDEQLDRFDADGINDPDDELDEIDDDPTAYDLPMTGSTYLRPGERRNLA